MPPRSRYAAESAEGSGDEEDHLDDDGAADGDETPTSQDRDFIDDGEIDEEQHAVFRGSEDGGSDGEDVPVPSGRVHKRRRGRRLSSSGGTPVVEEPPAARDGDSVHTQDSGAPRGPEARPPRQRSPAPADDGSIYSNPMCNVNVSKHFRVDTALREGGIVCDPMQDGPMHCFVCEGEGSSPPRVMFSIIRVLYFILNSPVTSEHIVDEKNDIRIEWRRRQGKGLVRTMKHITRQFKNDRSDPCSQDEKKNGTIVHGSILDISMASSDAGRKVWTEKIPLGQIKVVPVKGCGLDTKDKKSTKIFWLVVLKTVFVYDFVRHFCETLRGDPPRDHVAKKVFDDIHTAAVQILLNCYDWSPSAKFRCDEMCVQQGSIMPIDHADDEGALGLCSMCNIFEVYRGIVLKMHEAGFREICVEGFCDRYRDMGDFGLIHAASTEARVMFQRQHAEWVKDQRKAFQGEKKADGGEDVGDSESTDPGGRRGGRSNRRGNEGDELEEEGEDVFVGGDTEKERVEVYGANFLWGAGIGSIDLGAETAVDRAEPCIPVSMVCMSFFDVHEVLKRVTTEDEFVIDIGQIPEAASFEIMMNTYDMGIPTDGQGMLEAKKKFMANPRLLTESQRFTEFASLDNMFAGIVMGGHFDNKRVKFMAHMHDSAMPPAEKIDELNKYLQINLMDHDNIIRGGGLRNKNAQFALKYIDAAGDGLIGAMETLVEDVFDKEMRQKPRTPSDWSFWQSESLDPFLFYSWEHSELHHRMNNAHFLLAPMNFKLSMEIRATHVAHRLGGRQPGWKHIGMLNSVMDGGGLLPYKGEMRQTTKSTGSGLDHTRECFLKGMSTYEAYLGFKFDHDSQDPDVLRRWTEGSMYGDYITSIGSKIINMPIDVGRDQFINEQPRDKPEIVEAVFNQVQRDDQDNVKLRNTVDLNNNNNRQKTESQPVHGFNPFFNTISKNNMLSDSTEMRYQQMIIVTNPIPSKHMADEGWYERVYGDQSGGAGATQGQRGAVYLCQNVNKRKRYGTTDVKGPPMSSMQQKMWAPLSFFVQTIAGTPVAMSNKLGIWQIPVNYGCGCVIDMCYTRVCKSFRTFLDSTDQGNTPRYLDVAMCHAVSHTVLKRVHQMLRTKESVQSARLAAIQSLHSNGLHMAQVAPMLHDFVSRITPYPALILLSTMLNFVRVPILSLVSVLEVLHGMEISHQGEAAALKRFLDEAVETHMFLPRNASSDGRAAPSHNMSAYISSPITEQMQLDDTPFRCLASQTDTSSADVTAHKIITGKIMQRYKAVLSKCAAINDIGTMGKLITSVKGHEYDLSEIFGYTDMHNSRKMMRNCTGVEYRGMSEAFDSGGECDKMFVLRKTHGQSGEFAFGVRVWDALLFVSLMGRPRMDFGIVNDFAASIVTHLLTMVPRSMMPFGYLPAHHYDSLESCPTQGHFRVDNIGGEIDEDCMRNARGFMCKRPEQMLRNEHLTDFDRVVKFEYQSPGPTKMVEDDAFMGTIIHMQKHLNLEKFWHVPIDRSWEFDISWDWDISYPVMVYGKRPERNSEVLCLQTDRARRVVRLWRCTVDTDGEQDGHLVGDGAHVSVSGAAEYGLDNQRSTWSFAEELRQQSDAWTALFEGLMLGGIGPMPFIRRPGVAVMLSNHGMDEDEDGDMGCRVGCIIPHSSEVRGRCGCASEDRCYFCAENPFYEIATDANNLGGGSWRIKPFDAIDGSAIVPVGTMLLLRDGSPELNALYSASQAQAAATQGGADRTDFVVCRLQVPVDLVPRDGMLSVAVRVRRGVTRRTEVLYVNPADLLFPEGQDVLDTAKQYVHPSA